MHGYDEDKAKVIARLRRIEGQVRAITQMVEDDKYCIDILTQISASNSALKSVALLLLDDHLNHCVRQASIQGGEVADEKLAEASAAIARLVKSWRVLPHDDARWQIMEGHPAFGCDTAQ